MISLDDILAIGSQEQFRQAALKVFAFQARECAPYRQYLELIGVDAATVTDVGEIPFLPIDVFRTHKVYCGSAEPEIVFTSSSTGGGEPSKHYMAHAEDYRRTFRKAFATFYPGKWSIYALLPNYLQREGSSLVYMADDLIRNGGGGFYLENTDALLDDMAGDSGNKILLGVSYALWNLAEEQTPNLTGTVVMETGGMKGHREELPKEEFHKLLRKAFSVRAIASEYGMAELSSQAYSAGAGIFRCPPWMQVTIGDLNDPFATLGTGQSGRINIIDLANRYSCAFIATDDIGRCGEDGSFEVLGRADSCAIRGCNLLVQ